MSKSHFVKNPILNEINRISECARSASHGHYTLLLHYPFTRPGYLNGLLIQRANEILALANGSYSPCAHSVTFDASTLPSGTYLYRLIVADEVHTRKMILLK